MTLRFRAPEELQEWLQARGIDTSGWGKDGCKGVADLWVELQSGDAVLSGPPPLRSVTVVEVQLERDGRPLIELAQELAGGQQRQRRRLPAEKVKAGESCSAAAARCLEEEVGLAAEDFTVADAPLRSSEITIDSPSYPGLQTRYTVVTVPATAVGLPAEPFWVDNNAAAYGDPVLRHLWGWGQPG